MSKGKQVKFAELATFGNAIEGPIDFKGQWRQGRFGNNNPITLELGCGRGEYTIGLAQKNPTRNYIGVDLKGARIWRGAKFATENGLTNAVFIRCGIKYINEYFEANEIDEIWLPFPDPFPKRHNALKRLTSLSFLQIYKSILKAGGVIHLKTDDLGMYKYTLAMLKADNCIIHESTEDLHGDYSIGKIANDINGQIENDAVAIQTRFELQALAENKTIKYIRFGFAGGNDSGNSPKIG